MSKVLNDHTYTRSVWSITWPVVLVALAIRCIGIRHRGLWYDELISANFVSHGPLATLLTVLRFDVHPPLFYLQLSLWALVSHSDGWLVANAVFWSTLACGLLAYGAGRQFGWITGLFAGLLLAVEPAALAYSDQVRMYPMIMALIVCVWLAQARWLLQPSLVGGMALGLAEIAVVYSHTVGVIMLSGCVVLGAISLIHRGSVRSRLSWGAIQAVVALSALPVLFVDVSRNVGHIARPSLGVIGLTWTFLTTGAGTGGACMAGPVMVAVGVVCALMFLYIAVTAPVLRTDILALIVAPLVIAAMISIVKPIWLDRVFLTTLPFMALILARFAVDSDPGATLGPPRSNPWVRRLAPALIGLLWLSLGVVEQSVRQKTDGYTQAADYIARVAKPGDAVALADKVEFWVFMWRFAGSSWGDPLHSYTVSDSWARLTRKMPAAVQARLNPDRLCIPVRGIQAVLLSEAQPCPRVPGDVFTLAIPGEVIAIKDRKMLAQRTFAPLILQRWGDLTRGVAAGRIISPAPNAQ